MSQDVPIGKAHVSLAQLNDRSRDIFRQIVESYLATGEPVGSRNLARLITTPLSPASVRNVMSDLEQLGLIYAPHTSAGRLPTELGLRFFVDALMEVGDLTEEDRRAIEVQLAAAGRPATVEQAMSEAVTHLSGLTRTAAVVHHCGAGTTAAGLRAGVPAVGVPVLADQPFWARRLHALGAAPAPVPLAKLTPDRLAGALRSVTTDPRYAARAAAVAARLTAEDGSTRILRWLERPRPPSRSGGRPRGDAR